MIPFFIMAGGYGERARPLSDIKPKPLFPINGKPLLELMLTQLKEKGAPKGFINIHYKPDLFKEIIEKRGDIQLIYEKELSGNMILREALHHVDDLLLVINGDVYLDIPLIEIVKKFTVGGGDGVLLLSRSNRPDCPSIKLEGDNFVDRKIWEGPEDVMYTGVALLHRRVIKEIDQLNFVDTLIRKKFSIKCVIYDGLWVDLGSPQTYFEGNFAYLDHLKLKSKNSISKNVTIAAQSRVTRSIIWENTTISGSSMVSDSIILGNIELNNVQYHQKIITSDKIFDL